jgi:hypothetical protein
MLPGNRITPCIINQFLPLRSSRQMPPRRTYRPCRFPIVQPPIFLTVSLIIIVTQTTVNLVTDIFRQPLLVAYFYRTVLLPVS